MEIDNSPKSTEQLELQIKTLLFVRRLGRMFIWLGLLGLTVFPWFTDWSIMVKCIWLSFELVGLGAMSIGGTSR